MCDKILGEELWGEMIYCTQRRVADFFIVGNETSGWGDCSAYASTGEVGYDTTKRLEILAVSDEPLCRKGEKNTLLHQRKKKEGEKDTAGDGKACIFSDDQWRLS